MNCICTFNRSQTTQLSGLSHSVSESRALKRTNTSANKILTGGISCI
jgi:hypothetical protein